MPFAASTSSESEQRPGSAEKARGASSAPDAEFLRPTARSISLTKRGAASALDLTDASISASEHLETGSSP